MRMRARVRARVCVCERACVCARAKTVCIYRTYSRTYSSPPHLKWKRTDRSALKALPSRAARRCTSSRYVASAVAYGVRRLPPSHLKR